MSEMQAGRHVRVPLERIEDAVRREVYRAQKMSEDPIDFMRKTRLHWRLVDKDGKPVEVRVESVMLEYDE